MKTGSPIHVGGGHLVHLCHAVAYIPSLAGVMWHTEEDGYVFLWNDVRGHLRTRLIVDDVAFMRKHQGEYKLLEVSVARGPAQASFYTMLLEMALKKTEPK
jgi:hypothetical protein